MHFLKKAVSLSASLLVLNCSVRKRDDAASDPVLQEGHESNGGNELAANFIRWGGVIQNLLESSSKEPRLLTLEQLREFKLALNETNVEVVTTDNPFLDNHGAEVHARVTPDPKRQGKLKIQLLQSFWKNASPLDYSVCRIVFHEYLRVIGLDKQAPEDVYAISNRWNTGCAVANTSTEFRRTLTLKKPPWLPGLPSAGFSGHPINPMKRNQMARQFHLAKRVL